MNKIDEYCIIILMFLYFLLIISGTYAIYKAIELQQVVLLSSPQQDNTNNNLIIKL